MNVRGRQPAELESIIMGQLMTQSLPPVALLEQRVLELEGMGLVDAQEYEGVPSSVRQFAISTLQHVKPAYFITYDDDILSFRDVLELRYGVTILSVYEAMLLLRDEGGPPN